MPLLSTFGAASARSFGGIGAAAAGAGLDVDEVFDNFLYSGTGSAQTITNGIDLSGEGGLVWIKSRNSTRQHWLVDSERSLNNGLSSNETSVYINYTNRVNSFNSNGFTVGTQDETNASGDDYASWTFRKASKFFDAQTWTGNGSTGRTISHNLGSDPGMVIIKRTDGTSNWIVHHRSLTATKYLALNLTNSEINGSDVTATSSTNITLSDSFTVNGSSATYVGYFFAHNNGDGGFGPDADQDIIKCGSYTGNGNVDGPTVNVGFEPQWILQRRADGTSDWRIFDNMRELSTVNLTQGTNGYDNALFPNKSNVEDQNDRLSLTPRGFQVTTTTGNLNANGGTYIYVAVRRGSLVEPSAATDVFAVQEASITSRPQFFTSNFPVDITLSRAVNKNSDQPGLSCRLTNGVEHRVSTTNAEGGSTTWVFYDFMNGINSNYWNTGFSTIQLAYMWKRAPSFCDSVTFSGTTVSPTFLPQTIEHNLGAVPEMMWVKCRSTGGTNYPWTVYHKDVGNTKALFLNTDGTPSTGTAYWNNTSPTSTQFTVGGGYGVNQDGQYYVAYLFSSLDGISKVGSYTGDGTSDSSKVIDCGFSAGARFILIKNTDSTGGWYYWDSVRGIVGAADPYLRLDDEASEVTDADWIDPDNSGFAVRAGVVNGNGANYIFYAIA